MLQVPVRYIDPSVYPEGLKRPDKRNNWIDLRSRIDLDIVTGTSAKIPLGIAMKLPEGYEILLAPRSSTFEKWGIIQTNSIGVIDESYCGDNDEILLPVFSLWHNDHDVNGRRISRIKKGDRICQFRIIGHQPDADFIPTEHLSDVDRGGFGTSGMN